MSNFKVSKMVTSILVGLGLCLFLTLCLLIYFLPKKVQYVESIVVDAPVNKVYDAVRYQEQLMDWSAWPKETKSTCKVQNEDGTIGAQIIYMNLKGKKFGYQEITGLTKNEKITFYLKSFVAPFEDDVRMTFYFRVMAENQTEVQLFFDETLKKPQFLIAYFGGIIKWVHSMHLKDLNYLKAYVEPK
ncbi:MAG: hypothetical protein Roseis3KO_22530 [Roseivirga sp.]